MPVSNSQKRWHPEDIKAAVRKRGITLADLSRQNDLPAWACHAALKQPHSYGEAAISRFLDIPAATLWPDRYNADGVRLHGTRMLGKSKSGTRKSLSQNGFTA